MQRKPQNTKGYPRFFAKQAYFSRKIPAEMPAYHKFNVEKEIISALKSGSYAVSGGIVVQDDAVLVSADGVTAQQAEAAVHKLLREAGVPVKTFGSIQKAALSASESEALATAAGVDLKMGRIHAINAANTQLDRHRERFDKSVLDAMAARANVHSPSVLFGHDPDYTIGIVVKAEVVSDPVNAGGYILREYAYVQNGAMLPSGVEINAAIDSGALKHVSIGFRAPGKWMEVKGSPSESHWLYTVADNPSATVEQSEVSFVYFPAQVGAAVAKSAGIVTVNDNKNPKKMEKIIEIDGHKVTVKVNGDSIEFDGIESVTKSLTEAKAAAESLKTANAELWKALEPAIADIQNNQKALGYPESVCLTEAQIKAKSPADILKMQDELAAQVKSKGLYVPLHERTADNGADKPRLSTLV